MSKRPKVLILAPHIDDETIGCWSILSRNKETQAEDIHVAWFFELSEDRMFEAQYVADEFKITKHFSFNEEDLNKLSPAKILVPAITDQHVAHKFINAHWRKHATHFYSVDMVRSRPLDPVSAQAKREALDGLFPTQRNLWATNNKYFLFEDVTASDIKVMRSLVVNNRFTVNIDNEYFGMCSDRLQVHEASMHSAEDVIDLCLVYSNGLASVEVESLHSRTTWRVN